MKCLYCNSRACWCYGYLIGQKRYLCGTCLGLTEASLWHELARQWLEHRPEDWCDDVAGFLEEDHRADRWRTVIRCESTGEAAGARAE